MSIGSFFKALVPFASSAVSDVDKEVAAIQAKATADIATAKLKAGQQAASAANAAMIATRKSAWEQVKKDHEAFLSMPTPPSSPYPAPTGSTGPAGA